MHHFLALDLGAESGRGMIVTLDGGTMTEEEIHRFPNRTVPMAGTLHWDFPGLMAEIHEAIRICAHRGIELTSIGVDTWGVDFGLLGADGKLLGNPVCYRDTRTVGIHAYADAKLDRREIFKLTAYEPWPIASLFQLLAMQRDGSPILPVAQGFLNMPDLINYFLTGEQRSDKAIANTTNVMDIDGHWSRRIINACGLPDMFVDLVEPATVMGTLSKEVQDETGLFVDVPVVAACGHDTSAAMVAVPAQPDTRWAFLSCGTWSIPGMLIDSPITTDRVLELSFTNEYTVEGWYVAQNIIGLWLVQQLRRKWNTPEAPLDYAQMTAKAAEAGQGPIINAADDSLMAPADMEAALLALVKQGGQVEPAGRGELVYGVLQSLALQYNVAINAMEELTGERPEALYMVGGGTRNTLLCQLTADACGMPVQTGVEECTSLGNACCQALATGVLRSVEEAREVMRNSYDVRSFEPKDQDAWAKRRETYAGLQQG
ncbi:MAG: rhamnulokinase [Planctomycetes bacterium]|jgi:rhamnulokinase|nr:rhamnulokinase [Phycisphaerae bacterium]NBB96123.1 rhamnulokinase [Planctomycetota bacterium]